MTNPASHPSSHPQLAHVHETREAVALIEMSPPHAPRVETAAYRRARQFLIHEKRQGCAVCGVTIDTVQAPDTIEAHHFPIERSLVACCDPVKVHVRFPQVFDEDSLQAFVDSPANLITLCSTHHRSTEWGIHHLLTQDFAILPFLREGYQVAATPEDAAQVLARDEQVVQQVEPLAPQETH